MQEFTGRGRKIDATVQEGLDELSTLCATELLVNDQPRCNCIPQPRPSVGQLLAAAAVRLPEALPCEVPDGVEPGGANSGKPH